jgi:acyl-CoA thioester hydrolase
VVLVRNEINYKQPATFGQDLRIVTRISSIRNTSFVMEGMILGKDNAVIAENIAYHVWLDPETDAPTRVPDDFRRLVKAYEGANCTIMESDEERTFPPSLHLNHSGRTQPADRS